MLELFHLVMVEYLLDLIAVSDPTGKVWEMKAQEICQKWAFKNSLHNNAVRNAEEFNTAQPYQHLLKVTQWPEGRLNLYGVEQSWFKLRPQIKAWTTIANGLWDKALKVIDDLLLLNPHHIILKYPELWQKEGVRRLAAHLKGQQYQHKPSNTYASQKRATMLEELPSDEAGWSVIKVKKWLEDITQGTPGNENYAETIWRGLKSSPEIINSAPVESTITINVVRELKRALILVTLTPQQINQNPETYKNICDFISDGYETQIYTTPLYLGGRCACGALTGRDRDHLLEIPTTSEEQVKRAWDASWIGGENVTIEDIENVVHVLATTQTTRVREITQLVNDKPRGPAETDFLLNPVNLCSHSGLDPTVNVEYFCMRRTVNNKTIYCEYHFKEMESQVQVGLGLVQYCWGNRIRMIQRPTIEEFVPPIPPPKVFKDHVSFARSNWQNEKGLILLASNFLRQNSEIYRIDKVSRANRLEFERRFRNTDTSVAGVPLLFKIWVINAQVRNFMGKPASPNIPASEEDLKTFFQKMELRLRNQGTQPDNLTLWPEAIKRRPEGPDAVSNFNKNHKLGGILGGNEFGENFPLVGLGFQAG